MSLKARSLMLASMALAIHDPYQVFEDKSPRIRTKEEDESISRNHLNVKMKRGLKQWNIDGHTIYARNYKNACRKAENLKNPKNS